MKESEPVITEQMSRAARRVHARLWIVVCPNGEHFLIERAPIEGILEWAHGQDVTVLEYTFSSVAYEGAAT